MSLEKRIEENVIQMKVTQACIEENTEALKSFAVLAEAFEKMADAMRKFKLPTEDAATPPESTTKPKTEKRTKETKPAPPAKDETFKAKVSLDTLREGMKKAAAINREEVVGWIAEYGTLTDVPETEWDALYEKALAYVVKNKVDALD